MLRGATPCPVSQFWRLICWTWYGSRPVMNDEREGEQYTKA